MTGCSGLKESFLLDNYHVEEHERGDTDTHVAIRNDDLGGIKNIRIWHDNDGSKPGWLLDSVAVFVENMADPSDMDTALFAVHSWLDDENGTEWSSLDLSCPDDAESPFISGVVLLRRGEYASISGSGFGYDSSKVALNIGGTSINARSVTNKSSIFYVPSDLATGAAEATIAVGELSSPACSMYVRGIQPVFGGVGVTLLTPGDGFVASFQGIDSSSRFYLDSTILGVLRIRTNDVVLGVPDSIDEGTYGLRVVSQGWDTTYSVGIEVTIPDLPVVSSLSKYTALRGDSLWIYGSNFGTDTAQVCVLLDSLEMQVLKVRDGALRVVVPQNAFGDSLPVIVSRNGFVAKNTPLLFIQANPWFMSFDEDPETWTSTNADLSRDTLIRSIDSGASLQVHGGGYLVIASPAFNTTDIGQYSGQLDLDVWVPDSQSNQYWYGDAQMLISIPAAGLSNAWIGGVSLTGLDSGWNTVSFQIGSLALEAIAGDWANAQFFIVLNVNQNAEDWRVDNLRFSGDIVNRTVFHQVASRALTLASSSLFSFDNIEDWTSEQALLSFVESPKEEGDGALGVGGGGWMAIQSREFYVSELAGVSDILSFDLYVPDPQPNEYWVGTVALLLSCPEDGMSSELVGQQDLTYMFREEYNSIQFSLLDSVQEVLSGGTGPCQVELDLNVNNGAGQFIFDNMGFVQNTELAFVPYPSDEGIYKMNWKRMKVNWPPQHGGTSDERRTASDDREAGGKVAP